MKAVVITGPDGPDSVKVQDVETPEPAAGEVRVKINSAALNRRDYWITQGLYPNVAFPVIPGSDGAGTVDAVGKGADPKLKGREVVIYPARNWGPDPRCLGPDFRILGMPDQGTFAEYICVPADEVYPRPAHLDWEQAAAVPLAGLTSWRAVMTQGEVKPGYKVLVTGAGSGVSTFSILWSVQHGAEVWVSSGSEEKIKKAQELGAKGGAIYKDAKCYETLKEKSGGFDVAIDSAGGDAMNDIIDTLNPAGRFVFFGATLGNPSRGLELRKMFFRHTRIQGTTMGTPDEFKAMLDFLSAKKLEPVVDRVLPMDQASEAFRLLDTFSQTGKVVLKIA